jgi:hypothetical protein
VAVEVESGLVDSWDQNMKFFHMKAAGRAKRNRDTCLRREDG